MRGLVAVLLLVAAVPVGADMPPPPGYVEACTVEKQTKVGETCRTCSAWHGGREDCERLRADGHIRRCSTYGASVWQEVWCRRGAAGEPGPAGPARSQPAVKP